MASNNEVLHGEVLVLHLYIDSSGFVFNYTGKLSKTIILTEVPSLEYAFKPLKGFFKPLRVSPPIGEGGVSVIPTYVLKVDGSSRVWELKPVKFSGEYRIEVGATKDVVSKLYEAFKSSRGVLTRLRFENSLIKYVVNDVEVVRPEVNVSNKVFVKTVSPALLPSPLTPTQHVRRFTTSPGVMLYVPLAIANGMYTHNVHNAVKALTTLESCLAEHYATKQRTIFINYDNRREPALLANAKYMLIKNECRDQINEVLYAARVFGIGASRASGFGSIEIPKLKA